MKTKENGGTKRAGKSSGKGARPESAAGSSEENARGGSSEPPRRVGAGTVALAVGTAAALTLGAVFLLRDRGPQVAEIAPCEATGRLAAELPAPMKIEAFVSRGDPKLDAYAVELEGILRGLATASKGKLSVEVVAVTDEESAARAKQAGIGPEMFRESEGGIALTRRITEGLRISGGGQTETLKFLPPAASPSAHGRGLEYTIAGALRAMRDRLEKRRYRVGVLVGVGETKLADQPLLPAAMGGQTARALAEKAFPQYAFEDVDLRGGEVEIDGAVDALIVTQPGRDLTDKELSRLDQFVLKGKSLVVFASAVNVKPGDPTLKAQLGSHGLEKLLGGYGVELRRDAVLDFRRALLAPTRTHHGDADAGAPDAATRPSPSASAQPALGASATRPALSASASARPALSASASARPALSAAPVGQPPHGDGHDSHSEGVSATTEYFPMFLQLESAERGGTFDPAHPALFRMAELYLPYASSLVVHPEKQPDARVVVLARTSKRAVRVETDTVELGEAPAMKAPTADGPALDLAASVEGTLVSAFGQGKSAKPARVYVFSSAAALGNPLLSAVKGIAGELPPQAAHLVVVAEPYSAQATTDIVQLLKGVLDAATADVSLVQCVGPAR